MKTPNIQYIAVKGLIKNENGEVLVLQQNDPTISGHEQFHPPGGIVEPGETLKECLAREIKEELGVEAEVGKLVDVGEWYAERGENVMQFVGIFYECVIKSDEFKFQESEVSNAAWVNKENVESMNITEPSKSIIAKFLSQSS